MVQCHTIKVVERDNHIKVHSKDLSQLVHQHGVIGRENSYMVAWLVSVQYVQKVITLCSVLKVMKQDSSPSVSWRSDVVNDYVYPCRFPGEAPTVWAKRAFIITLVILWFVSVVIVPVFLSIYNFFRFFCCSSTSHQHYACARDHTHLILDPVMSNSRCMRCLSPPLLSLRLTVTGARKGFFAS